MSDETKNRSYLHQGEKAAGELVVSGGDAPKVEELAEEVFHSVPLTKQPSDYTSRLWLRRGEPTFVACSEHQLEAVCPAATSAVNGSHPNSADGKIP